MRSRGRGWIAVQGQASWAVARRPPITRISDPFECMAEGTLRRPWVLQWLLFSRPAGVPAPSARSRRVDRVFRGNLWTRGGPSGGRDVGSASGGCKLRDASSRLEHSDRSRGWIKYQSVHATLRLTHFAKHSLVRHKHLLDSRVTKLRRRTASTGTYDKLCVPT